jgi:hypothetical protein
VTTHVEIPEQPEPDQPVKRDPADAAAVSVTGVPSSYESVHVEPQEIEPTSEVTEPEPVFEIESTQTAVKAAVTARTCVIVTTHAPVPEHAPAQPAKRDPAEAEALSVTSEPSSYDSAHVEPHEIEPTSEATDPEPDPPLETESVQTSANDAATERACVIETTHVPVPEQPAPDQPAKREPAEADADSVTGVPSSKASEQVAPQLIAPTLELTVPEPAPLFDTDSVHTATKLAVTERA